MKKIIAALLTVTVLLGVIFVTPVTIDATSTKTKAMKAYKKFMKSRDSREQFAIAYIDNNSVPELILDRKATGSRVSGFGDLYTFKNNKIKKVDNNLCTFGNWNSDYSGGYFKYYKKIGIYIDDDSFQGCTVTAYYKFKNAKKYYKASKKVYADFTEITPATQYDIGNKKATKAKYTKYIKQITKKKKVKKAKLHSNTQANRDKYLK